MSARSAWLFFVLVLLVILLAGCSTRQARAEAYCEAVKGQVVQVWSDTPPVGWWTVCADSVTVRYRP